MTRELSARDLKLETAPSPRYSICICNYNMADTIERALRSVLDQIDETFEVLVVDDGSKDSSVDVLHRIATEYPRLRVISLDRDPGRMLGLTRNFSVEHARGEYVLQHIDADDVWEPFIKEFVQVFEHLEAAAGRPIFLQGQQVNMARRNFLLQRGPYQNIYRGEDRDLWLRLAAEGSYLQLLHRPFRRRLARPKAVQNRKSLWDTWSHMLYDLRQRQQVGRYIAEQLAGPFRKNGPFTLTNRIVRAFLVVPAWLASLRMETIGNPLGANAHAHFVEYRAKMSATYEEFMSRFGAEADVSFLSPEGLKIFREKVPVSSHR